MGSSGSGNFSDYSQSPYNSGQGGTNNDDICTRAFSARLEEVDRCEYYTNHHALPTVGETIKIEFRRRLVAISAGGEAIGYLPTELNYLVHCINAGGFDYNGRVAIARTTPILNVQIDCAPL